MYNQPYKLVASYVEHESAEMHRTWVGRAGGTKARPEWEAVIFRWPYTEMLGWGDSPKSWNMAK